MGIRMRGKVSAEKEEEKKKNESAMSSLRAALIMTTMRMVGLPVDVHVKDGSVYCGIFDTANVDGGYGIVLKKAKMVKRGTCVSNAASGVVIDTLVVLPGDLVQVVAKGVILSADGIPPSVACDNTGSVDSTKASFQHSQTDEVAGDFHADEEKLATNQKRRDGTGMYKEDNNVDQPDHKMQGPSANMNGFNLQKVALPENQASLSSKQLLNGIPAEHGGAPDVPFLCNGHSSVKATDIPNRDAVCSSVVKPVKSVEDATSDKSRSSADELPSQYLVAKRNVKESKLNPGAKTFLPSSMSARPAAPAVVPTVASMAYAHNNHPAVPITPQPEVGIRPMAPRSSWTTKFVPHGNFTVANGGNGLQYAQPVQIAGHIVNRAQPTRFAGQYQPVQAAVPYILTDSPNLSQGMIGRMGQLVYVHPVMQDMVQADPHASHPLLTPPQIPYAAHPPLTPPQIHIPKHDGFVIAQPPQLSLTPPPLMSNVQQPYPLPGHMQLTQTPFPTIHPIPVLGSGGPYDVKFM